MTTVAPSVEHAGRRAAVSFAASLEFEDVELRYSQILAVRGVSLRVEAGEIVCLLGPSGCGKTSLLRLASGIESPTSGRIFLNDKEIAGPTNFVPPEQRNVGLMFQDFALFPHLTILDNVAFGLKDLGRDAAAQEAYAALVRVGLDRYARDYPHILSGGQQQRVALARSLVPRPAIILMDEPFSGLDVLLRESLRDTTKTLLKETRATGIIVTHDPGEAMQLADRIVVMRAGHLVQTGTADHLYHSPADLFVARLFSQINEIPARVTNQAIETPFGRFPAPAFRDGSDVVLCVRHRAVRPRSVAQGEVLGRVLARRFQGDLALLTIAVSGMDELLSSLVREARAPAVGDEISIVVDPEGVLVFPRETEA
ncbi:MAG: ABC transporter ATP-binding protein [Hyphomicrobiaceae bacterium]